MSRRVKKKPISASVLTGSISRKVAQHTVSSVHILLKRRAVLERKLARDEDSSNHLRQSLREIDAKMHELGGMEAYQNASKLGQSSERGGGSSRVLIDWLKARFPSDRSGKGKEVVPTRPKLKMLELGALTAHNYASCSSWIENQPIDLYPQHPDILQQDFFQRPIPAIDDDRFDVISCSLVLNFVGEAHDRGKMLSLIHAHLRPMPSSLLFLVLPLPCLTNSRYISMDKLQAFMRDIGFSLAQEKWKKGGKVGYWLWEWREIDKDVDLASWKKKTRVEDGEKRNNFAIVLPR